MSKLRVISLGWGVQSFALAAMSALGELPPVDAAIHADTTHERSETYVFAKRWTPWLEERGVKVITVNDKVAANKIFGDSGQVFLPLYAVNNATGKRGVLRRSCTHRWKVVPIRRWVSEELKRRGLKKTPSIVKTEIGITLDEWSRMKDSNVKYIANAYPFMEMNPPMNRHAVMKWLLERDLEIPVKSSCTFCPYHSYAAWKEISKCDENWAGALEMDEIIRHKRPGYQCFLTHGMVPLTELDFNNKYQQMELWDEDECTGMCFL